jgi:hypothetical protein
MKRERGKINLCIDSIFLVDQEILIDCELALDEQNNFILDHSTPYWVVVVVGEHQNDVAAECW